MKKFFVLTAVAMMTVMSAQAQKMADKDAEDARGESLESYATAHGVPALSTATRQAIVKLKQW